MSTSGGGPVSTRSSPTSTSRPAASPSTAGAPRTTGAAAVSVFAGRYEIQAKLGQGAFGVVYRARDQVLDREVALKVLKIDRLGEGDAAAEARDRFLREAQTVAKLRHANIVPIYDLGEAQGYTYIAMQLVHGQPLDEWMKSHGTMDPISVCRIGAALAEALGYAHEKGIIHRDIKPANILLEGDDPQIADFGIAKVQQDPHRTREDVIVGTLSYMSPEQLRGEPLDGRSDLFSLGCVLLELLTKHRAFDGPNMTSIVSRIVNDPVNFAGLERPEVPRKLVEILRRLLEKERDKRHANGRELAEELAKLLPERQADTAEISRLAAEVARLQREKKRANIAIATVAGLGAAIWGGVRLLEVDLVAFLPVFALVSPAILIGLFYRDVLGKLSPVYYTLAGLFNVLVLVDSYYLWKLATPATEIAASFRQKVPPVTALHYDVVGGLVDNLFLVALVLNIVLVAVRNRRSGIVDWLNRGPVAAAGAVLLAGLMVFMFAAMAGHWNAMMAGLNLNLVASKTRQLEEEGRYEEVLEKFLAGARSDLLLELPWQRRLARLYRVTGRTAQMEECWANIGAKLRSGEVWNPRDPAGYLTVGRDLARLALFREDAVTVFRRGLEEAPAHLELSMALSDTYAKMGMPAEAAAALEPLRAPGGPLAPPETAVPPPGSSAAPPATALSAEPVR